MNYFFLFWLVSYLKWCKFITESTNMYENDWQRFSTEQFSSFAFSRTVTVDCKIY